MRISIERNHLAQLLAQATRVVESRNTIPILGCVRLVATADRLTVTATDLDIEVTTSATAECEPGAVCVDAKMLDGIVKKLPADAEIVLAVKDGKATITSGRSRFNLPTLPDSDWPSFSAANLDVEFTTNFAALFAPVKFAISSEETRFYLNGIYMHVADGKLAAVATDGHRLARNYGGEHGGDFKGIIVPRKTVDLVPSGEIAVALSETKIRFTAGDTVIMSKLIDGSFPDYQRVIPTGNDRLVKVDNATLRAATDRVAVVSGDRETGVKLAIADGVIALSVHGDGDGADEVAASYDGTAIEIGFSAKYLVEMLGNAPAGEVVLALADGGSPALFTSDGAPEWLGVLMPRRV